MTVNRLPGPGPAPHSVAIFRALALGDLLVSVPFLRAIRRSWPRAHVSLIGLPTAAPFTSRFAHYVDELIEFEGYPGIPEVPFDAARAMPFLERLRARQFDLAIQLQGNGMNSNAFVQLLGARVAAGSYLPAMGTPGDGAWIAYPGHAHEIHRLLTILSALGLPAAGDELEFPIGRGDRASLAHATSDERLYPAGYAVVHAGASIPSRRWPAERFAAVADALADDGLSVVLTGTAAEQATVDDVRRSMRHRAISLAGRTDLGALGALIADARVVVTNDTSVSHIAAATRTPSVVVFLASDPGRWAPVDGRLHIPVGAGRANACDHSSSQDHRCFSDACARRRLPVEWQPSDVPLAAVLAAVDGLLEATEPALAS
jgi:ADP-heptose:LPS heptosyltransferase